jgi:hypothetical protein
MCPGPLASTHTFCPGVMATPPETLARSFSPSGWSRVRSALRRGVRGRSGWSCGNAQAAWPVREAEQKGAGVHGVIAVGARWGSGPPGGLLGTKSTTPGTGDRAKGAGRRDGGTVALGLIASNPEQTQSKLIPRRNASREEVRVHKSARLHGAMAEPSPTTDTRRNNPSTSRPGQRQPTVDLRALFEQGGLLPRDLWPAQPQSRPGRLRAGSWYGDALSCAPVVTYRQDSTSPGAWPSDVTLISAPGSPDRLR